MARDEDWRGEVRDRVKEKSRGNYYKLREGENYFRILPNAEDKKGAPPKRPFKEYAVHWGVGPNNRKATCGRDFRTGEGKCWLCKKVEKLEASSSKGKQRRAKDMMAKPVLGLQVGYFEDSKQKRMLGPLLFEVNEGQGRDTLDAKLMAQIGHRKRIISDPRRGYNIMVERVGTGKRSTSYPTIEVDEDPSEVPSKILKKVKPFDDLVREYDEEWQKACYYGREDELIEANRESSEEDERTMKKKSKKKRDEDEDEELDEVEEDDEDENGEDEDEEEERPKKKKKKSKSKDEDEDEDEEENGDEDEDEDEEEERPKKKKKKSKSKDEDEDEDEDDEPKSKKKKKKSRDEDEDEDEDEDNGDEDEDEEEDRPKKKKKKKSKDEDEDSEDEDEDEDSGDEDEDEDEEEERPKKKSKKSRRK